MHWPKGAATSRGIERYVRPTRRTNKQIKKQEHGPHTKFQPDRAVPLLPLSMVAREAMRGVNSKKT
jgi:hypothetical protein